MKDTKLVPPVSYVITLDMYEPEEQEYIAQVLSAFLTKGQMAEYNRLLAATDDTEDQETFEAASAAYVKFIVNNWPRK